MNSTNEKSTLGKTYDIKLVKRLLGYAKPYWKFLLLSLILLLVITGLELLNPYLLKIVIDDHINGISKPMYELDVSSSIKATEFNDKKYIRRDDLENPNNKFIKNNPVKNIIKRNDVYYLVDYGEDNIANGIKLSKVDYDAFRQEDLKSINKISIYFFIVILFTFVFNYLQVYILNYTGQKIIFNIREEIFNHIQRLNISFFDKNPIGRLVTRVTNDTENLNEMYTSVLVNLFKDIFTLLGIIIIMIKLNYKLALISFALLPIIIVISIFFRNKIRLVYRLGRLQLAKINSSLNENFTGMKTIQIFNKEDKTNKKFDNLNKDYLETNKREVKIYAILRPSIEIVRSIGIALLIYFGGGDVMSNTIEFGVLYIFIDYLQRFFVPIMELAEKYNILQSSIASSERIFNVLDDKSFIENKDTPKKLDSIKGKIEFKNVWFAYQNQDWVLKDISFIINPGETVAFVGSTGAGKTSIINLITRFYDIQKGEILLDDINIKNIDKYALRKYIGVVLQDVFLFTGTIEDNIRLNNLNIDRKRVEEVAKYVNANKFIDKLPNGYDEPVMERGLTLSSGERQLLSFARTLAYDPKILILDEATSNIDTETESLIQDALEKLIKNRTSIAIAHRLSTIQHADNIIVLNKGEIKEMGNHQQLLKREGIYYSLYKLQYSKG
ncbi:ABC transporter ATP-binding protein [Tissierella creatinophila]|uniref:Putative multidrug resistance ABC transporter ATP-binding/permease protein YheH n=1 Tax=Tissierella creatinophila DSM 6911 TaxID=1123403 RepID=A0A1U7M5E1_TISCR|nr:ABC transporter ATP-binding protein [Tissierella creatinophila]OLS02527.1 putative multidrug resistance ABC transporter ATP-binding/permease protein YheH [Tissierella creatinophila DSM 6911]